MDDTKEIWWDIASRNRFGGHQAPQRSNVNTRPQGQYPNAGFRTGGGYQTLSNSLLQQRPYQTQFPSSYQFRNAGFQPQQPYQNRIYQPQQQQQRQLMSAPQGYQNRPPQQASDGQPFNKPSYQQQGN